MLTGPGFILAELAVRVDLLTVLDGPGSVLEAALVVAMAAALVIAMAAGEGPEGFGFQYTNEAIQSSAF